MTESPHEKNKMDTLLAFWERLEKTRQLTFHVKTRSKEEKGWNGKGHGQVTVTKEGDDTLIFHEKGSRQSLQGQDMNFSNVFRWTLKRNKGIIALEHLRQGPEHPVFLFHLAPEDAHTLASIVPHLCKDDCYYGQVRLNPQGFHLHWKIIGPKKNEEIDYDYS